MKKVQNYTGDDRPSGRVAIITRTKDRPFLLPRAINSVLKQTQEDWIHVIVNDGGDAEQLTQLLAPLISKYKGRILVVHSEKSQGMQRASNTGIEAVDSEFVVIHDDDDSWEPDFLEKTIQELEKTPADEIAGVVTQINWIHENISDSGEAETIWTGPYLPLQNIDFFTVFNKNPTAPIAFLYRRDLHSELGMYEPRWDVLGDWDFLLRVLSKYDISVIQDQVANYHWRINQTTPIYANTVTDGLSIHLGLRSNMRNAALRKFLENNPHSEGLLLALAGPISDQLESSKRIEKKLEDLERKEQERNSKFDQLESFIRIESDAKFDQLESSKRIERKLEDLERKEQESDAKFEKFILRSTNALDYHSWYLEQIHKLTHNVYTRLRAWEYFITRNPKLKPESRETNSLEIPDLNSRNAILQRKNSQMQVDEYWHNAKVISLDIFDTALIRKCGLPINVFDIMEFEIRLFWDEYPDGTFRELRVAAENKARSRYETSECEDITLTQIYEIFCEENSLDLSLLEKFIQIEVEYEHRVCIPDPAIKRIVERAQKDCKQVYFVSDMYLPQEVIKSLLKNAGYPELPLIVSSEFKRTKARGSLYETLIQETGMQACEILHIGDNRISDVLNAKSAGFSAVWWNGCSKGVTLAEQASETPSWQNSDLGSRITQGVARSRLFRADLDKHNIWETVGYELAGPIYTNFLSWVIEQAITDGVKKLFFLARDGHYLMPIFEQMKKQWGLEIEGVYIYASRRLFNLAAIFELDSSAHEFLGTPNPELSVRDFIERIGLDAETYKGLLITAGLSDLDLIITNNSGNFIGDYRSKIHGFFNMIHSDILTVAKNEREKLFEYFSSVGLNPSGTNAIVDIGWQGSSLRSIQKLLRQKAPQHQQRGYYFATWKFAKPVISEGGLLKSYMMHLSKPADREALFLGSVEAIEFFFTAPYPTITGIRKDRGTWAPIYGDSENTETMEANLNRLHKAALEFAANLLDIHPPACFHQPPDKKGYLDYAMSRFFDHPTHEEAQVYGRLSMRDAFGDKTKTKSLALIPKLPFFNKRKKIMSAYNDSYWRAGFKVQVPKKLKKYLHL